MGNWKLEGSRASLYTDDPARPVAEIALEHPEQGIRGLRAESALLQLTQPALAGQLRDTFIRGTDLVADYTASEAQPCEVRLYWHGTASQDATQLDLSAVVRTPAWICEPTLSLQSELEGMHSVALPEGLLGLTTPSDGGAPLVAMSDGDQPQLALMIFPSDLQSLEMPAGRMDVRLLGEPLEKGVIRTARLRLLCGQTLAWPQIADAWEQFLASPLPLTP